VLLVQTRMGPAAMERALGWVLPSSPTKLVLAGFCGALTDDLEVGSLVQPASVCDERGNAWPLATAPRVGPDARLVSVDRPVLRFADRTRLHQQTRATVVDMETAVAARLATHHGLPLVCLRAVSDGVRHELSAGLATALACGQVDLWQLAGAVARRPALARELWRLAQHSRLAARQLAEGIERLLGCENGPGQLLAPTSASSG
jgi:hypothetical protein